MKLVPMPIVEWADWIRVPHSARGQLSSFMTFDRSDLDTRTGSFWVTLAMESSLVRGAHLYHHLRGVLESYGTWTSPRFRDYGLAKKMWRFGMRFQATQRVKVHTCTDAGYALMASLMKTTPNVKFNIIDDVR